MQGFACSAGDPHTKPSFLLAQMGKGKADFWLFPVHSMLCNIATLKTEKISQS